MKLHRLSEKEASEPTGALVTHGIRAWVGKTQEAALLRSFSLA